MNREIAFRVFNKEENPSPMGGKGFYKENGYVLQYTPNHPNCNKRGYVMEHRLIIENEIGRYLIPRKELIHHINGIKHDNRVENLELTNPKDHAKGHVGERNENGRFVCLSKEFEDKQYRLYDKDRNLTRIYTLNELISKTFRSGKFEYRGVWTGLKDKNGKKVFEGDLLDDSGNQPGDYKFVKWTTLGWDNCNHFQGPDGNTLTSAIIGNIHENPELLTKELLKG